MSKRDKRKLRSHRRYINALNRRLIADRLRKNPLALAKIEPEIIVTRPVPRPEPEEPKMEPKILDVIKITAEFMRRIGRL